MKEDTANNFKKINVLIAGQVLTSRTETIEEYYCNKVNYLGVLGIANPYAVKGLARCTLYKRGEKLKEFPIFNVQLKGIYWLNQLLMMPVFTLYAMSMFFAVLHLRKKFDLFIGIACFSTLFGLFLKKLRVVKNVVYYTLDYYPRPVKFHINTLVNKTIWYLDRFCCKRSMLVWNISPRIVEARERLMNFSRKHYNSLLVPLTYGEKVQCHKKFEQIDKNALVFVGSLSWNQGLQLVAEALPDILKVKPKLKVHVIGKGVAGDGIKKIIREYGLDNKFKFHGFIEKEKDVAEIISTCTIGICPWTDDPDNNVIYADPGKPKLYAFCGIPIIVTKVTAIADEIESMRAGISIGYDKHQFVDAVLKILQDDETLRMYRENATTFAQKYTTENIFETVNEKVLVCMNRKESS